MSTSEASKIMLHMGQKVAATLVGSTVHALFSADLLTLAIFFFAVMGTAQILQIQQWMPMGCVTIDVYFGFFFPRDLTSTKVSPSIQFVLKNTNPGKQRAVDWIHTMSRYDEGLVRVTSYSGGFAMLRLLHEKWLQGLPRKKAAVKKPYCWKRASSICEHLRCQDKQASKERRQGIARRNIAVPIQ
jgi:hypothetical protein